MRLPAVRVTSAVPALPLPAARLAHLATAALRRIARLRPGAFASGLRRGGPRRPVTVSLVILGDPAIRRLNRRFLGHDCATDVISFPLAEEPSPRGGGAGFHPRPDVAAHQVSAVVPFGEIYVSTDTASHEAKARGIDPSEELVRYAIHGMLHLFGYDDRRPAARRRMWARQEALVREMWEGPSGPDRPRARNRKRSRPEGRSHRRHP